MGPLPSLPRGDSAPQWLPGDRLQRSYLERPREHPAGFSWRANAL